MDNLLNETGSASANDFIPEPLSSPDKQAANQYVVGDYVVYLRKECGWSGKVLQVLDLDTDTLEVIDRKGLESQINIEDTRPATEEEITVATMNGGYQRRPPIREGSCAVVVQRETSNAFANALCNIPPDLSIGDTVKVVRNECNGSFIVRRGNRKFILGETELRPATEAETLAFKLLDSDWDGDDRECSIIWKI